MPKSSKQKHPSCNLYTLRCQGIGNEAAQLTGHQEDSRPATLLAILPLKSDFFGEEMAPLRNFFEYANSVTVMGRSQPSAFMAPGEWV